MPLQSQMPQRFRMRPRPQALLPHPPDLTPEGFG